MKAIKVLINGGKGDGEEAKIVQEVLFGMGYRWSGYSQEIKYLSSGYYTTDENGYIYWGAQDETCSSYNLSEKEAFELVKKIEYSLSRVKKRETVKIGEHTYYKDEFEKAVANLQTV